MGIFSDFAPRYWAAGLPVLPLKRWDSPGKGAGKAPILSEWTQYGQHMPSEGVRGLWVASYPDSNIGLPFGPASGLCAIDIDTEDEEQIAAILGALPTSPWKRVGKKGMGLIFKWQGQPNFKLRDGNNQSIVEFLGQGNQMVLPPSIHPDTGRPYVANAELWDVLGNVLMMPVDIEAQLRKALGHIPGLSLAATARSMPLDVVPQGERDIQMVRHAGYLARVVLGIDKNAKFSLAEAMKHMAHWVENFTANTSGDDMDPDKGVTKLVEFLLKDVEAGKTLPHGWDNSLTEAQLDHPAIKQMLKLNESQRWTYTKARAWLEAQHAIAPEDHDRTFALVQELMEKLAKDDNFTDFDFNNLIKPIQQIVKPLTISKTDLKASMREMRRGDIEEAHDHEAIARFILDIMERGGEVRFDQGDFWQWNGSCFNKREEDEVYLQIAEGVKGNPLARRHNDYVSVTKTLSKISRKPLAGELEPGINFANGFLDTNLQLHDHSPKYGKTFTMPFNYVPERAAEAHKWLEYLERSWGDDEDYTDKVAAMQEAFASTMFGLGPDLQRAILLHGKAGTGKTQALEVLRAMMPPAAQASVPPTVWNERFQLVPLVGKTLNVCGELPEEAVLDGRSFKEIIEGTSQNTEFKGGAIFPFKPLATHWFGSNFLPRSRDTSQGFVRRWLILDFNRVVPPEEKVLNFHKVLIAEEREAIAAWAVQGLSRLMKQRDYTQPVSHLKRLNQVSRGNNSVMAFLQSTDRIEVRPGSTARAQSVFDYYIDHMKLMSRGYSVSYERFIQMMGELGHEVENGDNGVGGHVQELTGLYLEEALFVKKR